jgi:hypothetical protein
MISMALLSIHRIIQARISIQTIMQMGKVQADRTIDWKAVIESQQGNDVTGVPNKM